MLVHLVSKGSTFSAFYSEKYPNRKKRKFSTHKPETLGTVKGKKADVSSEGLTLETSAFLPFTVANLRFQPSC